jgi:eukaryotic-like serine/threonine-protein kinase
MGGVTRGLVTGSLLAGRYEIVSAIATGGMGEVWRARDRVLDRIVAAKVLRSEYTGDPSFLARFRNEARHTAALTHPNIASVYDYGETTDETGGQQLAFLVMEYVDGQPLHTILHDAGRLPVDWTLHVLAQSAEGLSAAHRAGVVHRDIKPGNLLVRPDGVVKLTDFGIAQARDATPLTKTGMVVGTAQYLSPEQAQGMEVTSASDVYSLGVVAYECLAGVRPFDGASQVAIALAHINRPPPPLPADIPPAVRLLVERALAKDPADRFSDGADFAEAVHRVAAGGSPTGAAAPAVPVAPATTPTRIVDMGDGATQMLPATGPGAAAGPGTGRRPLPPLAAGGDDDHPDDGYPDDEPPGDDRRGRRWLWIALALLLVALLGVAAWWLLDPAGGSGSEDPRPTASSAAPTSAATVQFDPADWIGTDYREAEAALAAQGLSVTTEPATADQLAAAGLELAPGGVAATDPATAGPLDQGADVVLSFAEDGYVPGGGEEPEEPTPPSEEPTPPSEEPTPPSEEPTPPSEEPTPPSEGPTPPREGGTVEPTEPTDTEPDPDAEPNPDAEPTTTTEANGAAAEGEPSG